ncbi:MAG: WXG100 family type VII secretion target [Candidatus Odinarchaeota archaeon]
MKVLKGLNFDDDLLHAFATLKTKKKGLLRRESLEHYQIGKKIVRQFRYIHFFDAEGEFISTSLLDEEFASIVKDFEERLLLWRPRYINLVEEEASFEFPARKTINEEALRAVAQELINTRKKAQENLADLQTEIAKTQNAWKSAASFLLPRTPSSIMKQEDIAGMKRSEDAVIRASSLLIGCSDDSVIESAKIGDYILVATILIRFSSNNDESTRILALENPSAENFEDALSKGRALTRLMDINEKCRQIIIEDVFNSNWT